MKRPTPTSRLPQRGAILIVEDDAKVVDRLAGQVRERFPDASVSVKTTQAEAKKAIERDRWDAVSIDWELHEHYVGGQLLNALSPQGTAAKLVYTQHETEADRARKLGADEFALKGNEDFVELMTRGLRLSRVRQLIEHLRVFGKNEAFPADMKALSETLEQRVHSLALSTVVEQRFDTSPNATALKDVLAHVGWWERLDAGQYARLPHIDKLRYLADVIGLSDAALASSLDVPIAVAHRFLDPAGAPPEDPKVRHRMDLFLSVCSYFLRVSGYEPELMAYHWRQRGIFAQAKEPPPWDADGIEPFLQTTGTTGLDKAIEWIRSH